MTRKSVRKHGRFPLFCTLPNYIPLTKISRDRNSILQAMSVDFVHLLDHHGILVSKENNAIALLLDFGQLFCYPILIPLIVLEAPSQVLSFADCVKYMLGNLRWNIHAWLLELFQDAVCSPSQQSHTQTHSYQLSHRSSSPFVASVYILLHPEAYVNS